MAGRHIDARSFGRSQRNRIASGRNRCPWTFAFALFVLSVLVNSQGATVATLFPIGISLGIPAPIIIGTFVAVNGYFFIPNYGPIIAAIDFDSTGSTKIGKFIFNHSFMIPGLLSMAFSLAFGLLLANYFFKVV